MLEVSRISVWNKNTAVAVIAVCIWLINGAFILQRKSLFPSCSILYQQLGLTRDPSGNYAVVDISNVRDLCFQ